jgi:hypothetical protein
MFAVGSAALRLIGGQKRHTQTEVALLGVLAAVALVVTVAASLRALSRRWRSAPAVESVAGAMSVGILTLIGGSGLLALAWRGVLAGAIDDVLPKEALAGTDLGLVLAPTLVAAFVLVRSLRRATSTT